MKFSRRRKTIFAVIVLANIFVLSALLFGFYNKLLPQDSINAGCNLERIQRTLIDKSLPAFEFNDFQEKNRFEESHKGKVLLIALKTDCGSCQNEVKKLAENYDEITKEIAVIGVAAESREKVQELINSYNIKFPILIDKQGAMFKDNRVTCTPTNFFMENGVVKKVTIGEFDDIEEVKTSL